MNYTTYLSIAIAVFLLAWTTVVLLIRRNLTYSKKLEQNRLETYIKVIKDLKEQKDQAYKERNILVALLAQVFPSGIKKTAIEGWNPEWHNCVYIELPDGSQCSWHYHDRDSYLFENLPPYEKEWDGHTTENKYFNIEELIASGSIIKYNLLQKWRVAIEDEKPAHGLSAEEFIEELINVAPDLLQNVKKST